MRHGSIVLAAAALAAGALAATAAADGLPVLGIDVGLDGLAAPSGAVRYVTVNVARQTVVAQTTTHGGRILALRRVPGTFTIPAVAYDGSASGLSADGSRLVLIEPRRAFPRSRTSLAILDVPRLRLRGVVRLRGDYSFDAIAPDGRTFFLVHYLSPTDPTRYEVRAFDVRSRRLLPGAIVDPEEPGPMRGSPLSRATSADGRWAYTLYDGGGATPFVHALDTTRRAARCIDVPVLAGRRDLWQLHLALGGDGKSLAVRLAGRTVARVDTPAY